MPRPFGEKIRDWRWWGEEQAHNVVGAAIVAAVGLGAFFGRYRRSWRVWILVAFALSLATGIGREIVQNWGDADNDVLDSIADSIAWASGSAAMAAILWAIARRLDRDRED